MHFQYPCISSTPSFLDTRSPDKGDPFSKGW